MYTLLGAPPRGMHFGRREMTFPGGRAIGIFCTELSSASIMTSVLAGTLPPPRPKRVALVLPEVGDLDGQPWDRFGFHDPPGAFVVHFREESGSDGSGSDGSDGDGSDVGPLTAAQLDWMRSWRVEACCGVCLRLASEGPVVWCDLCSCGFCCADCHRPVHEAMRSLRGR